MGIKLSNKRTITPEKAVKVLAEYGTIVTKEKAELILALMYQLTINQTTINDKIK